MHGAVCAARYDAFDVCVWCVCVCANDACILSRTIAAEQENAFATA